MNRPLPAILDDYVVVEDGVTLVLPIRAHYPPQHNLSEIDRPFSDDEIELVSRPGSVRSLSSSSPTISAIDVDEHGNSEGLMTESSHGDRYVETAPTHISKVQAQAKEEKPHSGASSQPAAEGNSNSASSSAQNDAYRYQRSPDDTFPGAGMLVPTKLPTDVQARVKPSIESPAPRSCISHIEVDHHVFDMLINSALNTRLRQESQSNETSKSHVRLLIMARLRSLPAYHPVIQEAMKLGPWGSYLLPRRQLEPTEIKRIYQDLFTGTEKTALLLLIECHKKHFTKTCHFADVSDLTGGEFLHSVDSNTFSEGVKLAFATQCDCFTQVDSGQIMYMYQHQFLPSTQDEIAMLAGYSNRTCEFESFGSRINALPSSILEGKSREQRIRSAMTSLLTSTIIKLNVHSSGEEFATLVNRRRSSALKREAPDEDMVPGATTAAANPPAKRLNRPGSFPLECARARLTNDDLKTRLQEICHASIGHQAPSESCSSPVQAAKPRDPSLTKSPAEAQSLANPFDAVLTNAPSTTELPSSTNAEALESFSCGCGNRFRGFEHLARPAETVPHNADTLYCPWCRYRFQNMFTYGTGYINDPIPHLRGRPGILNKPKDISVVDRGTEAEVGGNIEEHTSSLKTSTDLPDTFRTQITLLEQHNRQRLMMQQKALKVTQVPDVGNAVATPEDDSSPPEMAVNTTPDTDGPFAGYQRQLIHCEAEHHKWQNFVQQCVEAELNKHRIIRVDRNAFQCMVPDPLCCEEFFPDRHRWTKHVRNQHRDWLQKLEETVKAKYPWIPPKLYKGEIRTGTLIETTSFEGKTLSSAESHQLNEKRRLSSVEAFSCEEPSAASCQMNLASAVPLDTTLPIRSKVGREHRVSPAGGIHNGLCNRLKQPRNADTRPAYIHSVTGEGSQVVSCSKPPQNEPSQSAANSASHNIEAAEAPYRGLASHRFKRAQLDYEWQLKVLEQANKVRQLDRQLSEVPPQEKQLRAHLMKESTIAKTKQRSMEEQAQAEARILAELSSVDNDVRSSEASAAGEASCRTPFVRYIENTGIPWVCFQYQTYESAIILEYTIRCDIGSVDLSTLDRRFVAQHTCFVRTRYGAFSSPAYEFDPFRDLNEIAYALAYLNPCLRSQLSQGNQGLLQQAATSVRDLQIQGELTLHRSTYEIRRNNMGIPWLAFQGPGMDQERRPTSYTVRCDAPGPAYWITVRGLHDMTCDVGRLAAFRKIAHSGDLKQPKNACTERCIAKIQLMQPVIPSSHIKTIILSAAESAFNLATQQEPLLVDSRAQYSASHLVTPSESYCPRPAKAFKPVSFDAFLSPSPPPPILSCEPIATGAHTPLSYQQQLQLLQQQCQKRLVEAKAEYSSTASTSQKASGQGSEK